MSNFKSSSKLPDGMEFIDENDTFDFECQRCGACCMNRDDIILNSYDIFNAAHYLNITTEEFIEKYTHQTLGGISKIPMVVLKSKEDGMCPFLEFDYINTGLFGCSINPAKPGACAAHPLGLVTKYNRKTNHKEEAKYVKVPQCENSKKPVPQKVKDWMKYYTDHKEETELAHEFINKYTKHFPFRKWYFIAGINAYLSQNADEDALENPITKAFAVSCSCVMKYTYMDYDISKPYIPQCKHNLEEMEKELTQLDVVGRESEKIMNELLASANATNQEITIDVLLDMNDKGANGPVMDLSKLAALVASRFNKEEE